MCRIQGATEDFRNEIRIVLFDYKYGEQLNALCQNISQNKKKLTHDQESLERHIRASVEIMRDQNNFSEEHLLSKERTTYNFIKQNA